jgi:HlyD family secretion protein
MLSILMRRITKIVLTLLLIGGLASGGLAYWRSRQQKEQLQTVTAERHRLTQEVTFSGHLEATDVAKVGFATGGHVESVMVETGQTVQAGQVLAMLDGRTARLELAKARAERASSQVESQLTWRKAEADWQHTVEENNKLLAKEQQSVRDAKKELDQSEEIWQQTVRESGDQNSLTRAKYLAVLQARSAYHAAQEGLKQTTSAVAKSQAVSRAAADVAHAQYLATQQASARVAGLSSLEAVEQLAQVHLEDNLLHAPLTGVVTEKNINAGEVAPTGQAVITIATTDQLKIVASVPETDITKLSVGLPATVTLDAEPNVGSWPAEITAIDPASVTVEGVPTYKVTLHLTQASEKLRPGFTANVTVQTAQKENVLTLPRRALIRRNNNYFVRVMTGPTTTREQPVTIGLTGLDGEVEITSGLSGGEQIVIPKAQ